MTILSTKADPIKALTPAEAVELATTSRPWDAEDRDVLLNRLDKMTSVLGLLVTVLVQSKLMSEQELVDALSDYDIHVF